MNSQIPVFLHFEGSTIATYPWKPRIHFRSGIIDGVPWKYCQEFQIIRKDWKSGVHPWEQSRDPLSRGKVHYPEGSQGWIPSALIFLALSFQAWREWQALEAARNSLRNIPAKFKAPFPTRGLFPSLLFWKQDSHLTAPALGDPCPRGNSGNSPRFLPSPALQRRRSATCSSSAPPAGSWHPGHRPRSPPGRITLEEGMQECQEEAETGKNRCFTGSKQRHPHNHSHRNIPRQNFWGISFKNKPVREARQSQWVTGGCQRWI